MENKNRIHETNLSLIKNKDILKKIMEQSFISGHRPAQMHQKHCMQVINKKEINAGSD